MIRVTKAAKVYAEQTVLEGIDFHVPHGQMFGIIGPNGSGKSTLLKLISGIERADSGYVELDGRPVETYTNKNLARWVAVLQQDTLPAAGFKVRDIVEMGRYPFQNWLGDEGKDAGAIIDKVMHQLCIEHLADRTLDRLSGGERQRVGLAKVMAQQPRLLLLDEPTTYLDIGYQIQMMDIVLDWQRKSGLTVVAVLHDLNLASQYCERILVLHQGIMVQIGEPKELMNADLIERVYGTKPVIVEHPTNRSAQLLLESGSTLKGDVLHVNQTNRVDHSN
jgi:iron complex transport system ATP-binding protein